MFAELFGIRPWEWEDLNAPEVLTLVRYVDDMNKEARRSGH